ncbi:MAG: hypothetical protein H6550_02910 [Chitinophagales bacterium]|nr:hypothetical protein [Chitinophagales bacterium]
MELVFEILFSLVLEIIVNTLGRFAVEIRNLYYKLKYPNKYLRAEKMTQRDSGIPTGSKVASWIFVITVMLLLLLLFYKLTGFFD